MRRDLPVPDHYNSDKVGEVWRVEYQKIAESALNWTNDYDIKPGYTDKFKICLLLIDVQNTFCIPGFELYVGGRSGTGAVDDNRRLCEFIYRNLHRITRVITTMDTHQAMQIFHSIFLVDKNGNPPPPFTTVTAEDITEGRWKINTHVGNTLEFTRDYLNQHLKHYTERLKSTGKYDLTIWPYHAILGGIGHALVPAVEEAIFFHTIARSSQPYFLIKGGHPLTEHYSILGPEVDMDASGKPLIEKNKRLLKRLLEFDAVIVAGQAKSHCVAWTVEDLLTEISSVNKDLAGKVHLLEDCTSPVVVPGVIDYTDEADATFERFANAGMHLIRSTDSV